MKIVSNPMNGLYVLEATVFKDKRGHFLESYNEKTFHALGFDHKFVQDNQSLSTHGVLRGLHFQKPPMAQAKLVWVTEGRVMDYVVDLRQNSATYKKSFSIELSSENFRQLLVPRGFAHGFICLSERAVFSYKCDNFYSGEHDAGIRFDDPSLNLEWPLAKDKIIVSEKDQQLPFLKEVEEQKCF